MCECNVFVECHTDSNFESNTVEWIVTGPRYQRPIDFISTFVCQTFVSIYLWICKTHYINTYTC